LFWPERDRSCSIADVGRAFEAGMICTIRYDAYDFCAPLKANE